MACRNKIEPGKQSAEGAGSSGLPGKPPNRPNSPILAALMSGEAPIYLVCRGRRMYYHDQTGNWVVTEQGYQVHEAWKLADTDDEADAVRALVEGDSKEGLPDDQGRSVMGELEDGQIAVVCRDRRLFFRDGDWVVTAPGYTPYEDIRLVSTLDEATALRVLVEGFPEGD